MEGVCPPFIFNLFFMALYYDLPIFKEVYKLTLLIYNLTKDFSKEYKYTLGACRTFDPSEVDEGI
jgi:hypothetical protein